MRPQSFKFPGTKNSFFKIELFEGDHFYDRLHYHDEWQIAFIIEGEGELFVGDSIKNFTNGNVFIFGSNLPHMFKNDPVYYTQQSTGVKAAFLFFDFIPYGKEFLDIPELETFNKFLSIAKVGLKFKLESETYISQKMMEIITTAGIKRLVYFFELIDELSNRTKYETLSAGHFKFENKVAEDWLNNVIHFSMENYNKSIQLKEIADIAHLSVSAFSRVFKLNTHKSYIEFLNDIRISKSCDSLKSSKISIKQIAEEVGFSNISNFNRCFKKKMGFTPSAYRRSWI